MARLPRQGSQLRRLPSQNESFRIGLYLRHDTAQPRLAQLPPHWLLSSYECAARRTGRGQGSG